MHVLDVVAAEAKVPSHQQLAEHHLAQVGELVVRQVQNLYRSGKKERLKLETSEQKPTTDGVAFMLTRAVLKFKRK